MGYGAVDAGWLNRRCLMRSRTLFRSPMSRSKPLKENDKSPRLVVLAIGGAPHGIMGELRIKTFTEDPLAIGSYGPLTGSDGRTYEILSVRPAKNVVVARLKGVESREAAQALNGVELSITRDALGDASPEEGEFFHADLIGLVATDRDGGRYGKIVAIHDFGGGDMLELAGGGRKSILIPFSEAAVPEIDIDGGTVTVEPMAAGLIDEPENENP